MQRCVWCIGHSRWCREPVFVSLTTRLAWIIQHLVFTVMSSFFHDSKKRNSDSNLQHQQLTQPNQHRIIHIRHIKKFQNNPHRKLKPNCSRIVFNRKPNILLNLLDMRWYKSKHLILNYFKSYDYDGDFNLLVI